MTDLPDEETIRIRRGRSAGPPAERTDDTQPGEATQPAGETEQVADTQPDDLTEPAGRRAETAAVAPGADDAGPARRRATYVGGSGADQTDGSTFIARRETRRRAERVHTPPAAASAPPPDDAPRARVASSPDPAFQVYGPRIAEPAVVARTAPQRRSAQVPVDGAVTAAAQRRKARRTALIVVISASVVALAAGASLIALTINL